MKSYYSIVLLAALVVLNTNANGQEGGDSPDRPPFELEFSAIYAASLSGSVGILEDGMNFSGFGSKLSSIFGPVDNPDHDRSGLFLYDVNLYFSPRRGILISFGKLEDVDILGYRDGIYNVARDTYLSSQKTRIDSEMNHVSLGYTFRSPGKKAQLTVGISYITQKARFLSDQTGEAMAQKVNKAGLFTTMRYNVVNKRRGFIGVRFSGHVAPKSEFDEFVVVTDEAELKYKATDVAGIIFNLGITAGLRLSVNRKQR